MESPNLFEKVFLSLKGPPFSPTYGQFMSKPEISKAYQPQSVEDRWYHAWLEKGAFQGKVQEKRESFSVVIPPPNVTGVLTMGHVLNNTLQDVLIRRARQEGKEAMWLPGTDHAGIATQTRVEKQLRENEGKTRRDLGRDAFLEKVWEWKEKHGGIIIEQLKKLGCSCDWDREVFTMDPAYSKRVQEAFVRLFHDGHIYRGKRMVNWCPVSLTALSDEEVIMKEQSSILYHLKYEIDGQPGKYVEISTTRPETIMGDTAVAVHPEDDRYRHLIGGFVWRPFPRAKIPVVADSYIDRSFGTGVLKVTPAHDKADFEIGQRHQLPVIDVFHPDGRLNNLAGPEFSGLDRFEARKKAAMKLRELGLMVKEEPYQNNVGFSERADVPIEPRLSEQWFLRYPCVEEAKQVVRDGLIRFYPERWVKTYLHWLDHIQDWCISRQLWWGHRIPVWYRKGSDRSLSENWHVSLEGPDDPENWEQEDDVLDTWASSWLWPFATMGWPDAEAEKVEGLDYFYPTAALVTGPDIIFFWVARMIMAGLYFMRTGEESAARIPFRNVYFTGIIRDIEGRKMSKSLGNSPDPLDLIKTYGADGLRLGILLIAPQGQDIRFSEERVKTGQHFCNKLWNACRFRMMQEEATSSGNRLEEILDRLDPDRIDGDDRAILWRLRTVLAEVEKNYVEFAFNTTAQTLFQFFWSDFCDWYVEVSKSRLADPEARASVLAVQDLVIRQLLQMLHPLTPFITEELWQVMGFGEGLFLQDVELLSASVLDEKLRYRGISCGPEDLAQTQVLQQFVSQARALKAEYQLASRPDVRLGLVPSGDAQRAQWQAQEAKLLRLVGAASISEGEIANAPVSVTPLGNLYLDLAGSVDVEAEKERLGKELAKLSQQVEVGRKKLSNPTFVDKAPEKIVAGARAQLAELENKHAEVRKLIEMLG